MTSIFIVRPFGRKSFTDEKDGVKQSFEVDFDEVHRLLIEPAVAKNGLECQTTGVIAEAGNIRVDMFQMLIAYDLVIADISIDNANVFYELGIRHGLRPKGTILLRFPTSGKDVPFDLKTDRYVAYDRNKPGDAVDQLAKTIEDTLEATRNPQHRLDSPVFLLLPDLHAPDPATLLVVPREFQEAVEKAEKDDDIGRTTLALLGEEAKRTTWGREGLRLVGRAQRRIRAFKSALETWEFVRRDLPDDIEANLQLATIYQRRGDLVTSSQACRRVLNNADAQRKDRADAYSQLARNEKMPWVTDFGSSPEPQARRRRALAGSRLIDAFGGYRAGFAEDLNDYYSGINAFGLLTAIVRLAESESSAWVGRFPTKKRAQDALDDYGQQLEQLRGAVFMSIENARQRSERSGVRDDWLAATEAQFGLLTADNPDFVRNAYQAAKDAGGTGFSVESEAQQVAIFHRLGLLVDNCQAAFEALGMDVATLEAASGAPTAQPRNRVIVATGHRADAAGRASPRFPNTKECIDKARAWLREAIEKEKALTEGSISGIGGAASGADLLFHEVCKELGIATRVVLPIPVEDYRRESVADGGPEWMEKFAKLMQQNAPIILRDSAKLPPWTRDIRSYGVFQRGNIWMVEDALQRPNADTTLIALWNGKAGDGPGGTADMVRLAQEHGAKVVSKDSDELFGLPKQP
jgi:hypothetical protein